MKKIKLELTEFELNALHDLISGQIGNLDTGDIQFEKAIDRIYRKIVRTKLK